MQVKLSFTREAKVYNPKVRILHNNTVVYEFEDIRKLPKLGEEKLSEPYERGQKVLMEYLFNLKASNKIKEVENNPSMASINNQKETFAQVKKAVAAPAVVKASSAAPSLVSVSDLDF